MSLRLDIPEGSDLTHLGWHYGRIRSIKEIGEWYAHGQIGPHHFLVATGKYRSGRRSFRWHYFNSAQIQDAAPSPDYRP